MTLAAAIEATLKHTTATRGPAWAVRAIESIAQARATLAPGPRSGTAIVVGAGPSLDLAGPHLETWQKQGALIVSTNTAARACVAHGVQPDIVCIAELDPIVSTHLDGVHPTLVSHSPFVAHETLVAVTKLVGPSRACITFGPEPGLMPYALALGCEPIWYFGCVAVMAIGVARYLGASRIVLAGVDAAYTDRMYAKHTPFEDLMPEVRDGLVLTRSDRQTPSKTRGPVQGFEMHNNAGGVSLSDAQLLAPLEYIPVAGKGCELETVSPHGVAIDGVRFLDASDVRITGQLATRGSRPVWAPDARSVVEKLGSDLRAWDPSESVLAPASVPLASFWKQGQVADPRRQLVIERQRMTEARAAMLGAVERAMARA